MKNEVDYLNEQICFLRMEHEKQLKPYIDRLVKINSMEMPVRFISTKEMQLMHEYQNSVRNSRQAEPAGLYAEQWHSGVPPYIENAIFRVRLKNGSERIVKRQNTIHGYSLFFTDCTEPAQNAYCADSEIFGWMQK